MNGIIEASSSSDIPLPPRAIVAYAPISRAAELGSGAAHVSACASHADTRRRYVLVDHEEQTDSLHVLVRLADAEMPTTRDLLRSLGFVPTASPADASVGWRLSLVDGDLFRVTYALFDALAGEVVLDLGASFAASSDALRLTLAMLPEFWPGRFLLHVGGTNHSVVFDRSAEASAIAQALETEQRVYEENDFRPASE